MTRVAKVVTSLKILGAACLVAGSASVFAADEPAKAAPAAASDAAKQAIAVRKAAFLLIANNFKPIGEVLQGKAAYNQAEIVKRAQRVAFLSELLDGTFPAESNLGVPQTKTKAEAFTKKEDFDKLLKEFVANSKNLAQVAAKESTASDAFKNAAKAVAEGCKGCHDKYKEK
ncbi:c-type cytochrome [Cellvibrio mixtus]|uniref:c-type cytochrome n=1 Tax=Cellvibrio mixtus TaxID=39650 RepID=UPI0005878231|nr:cytochrome c [Cellvibrio mixtus]